MLDFNMKTGPLVVDWSACDKAVIEEAIAAGAICARARECVSGTIYFNNGSYVDARFNGADEGVSGAAVVDTIFELFRISMAGLPGACGYQVAAGAMAARIPEIVNLRPNNVNIDLMRKLDHKRSGVVENDDEAIDRLFDQWEPQTAPVEKSGEPHIDVAAELGLVGRLGAVMEADNTADVKTATEAALCVLGFERPRVDFFVDGVPDCLGGSDADENRAALEEYSSGVVRVRFSAEGTAEVNGGEAVQLVLQIAAQRLQTVSGRTFSGRIEVTDFVADDPVTQSVLSNLRDFAALDGVKRPLKHICLVGERGVGKEKFAQLIHKWSSRAEEPYVAIHFGAVPNELASSELFGARKGAYSGSVSDRGGIVQRAGAGTLFLDELDEASESLQALIKRVVQLGVFNVVGDASESKTSARFIAATNVVDVDSLKIKKDLKDRFLLLRVPPLRERRADIRPLAERFAAVYELVLPEPALALLERLDWPGNVRQLQTVIDRSCAIAGKGGALTLELVQRSAVDDGLIGKRTEVGDGFNGLGIGETLESRLELEAKRLVAHALKTCNGKRTHAAAMLGVTRQTLYDRMKRYGLD